MLSMIREHGTRRQYADACVFAARGDQGAIASIYRKIVGN